MIKTILKRVVAEVGQLDDTEIVPTTPEIAKTQIPTLQVGVYHSLSPQLHDRFAAFGAWPEATHANWLSLSQMEELWEAPNEKAAALKKNLEIISANWENDAVALFQANRISVFALSEESTERIYLLWLDCFEEPEVWVYDTNGAARYLDLKAYLQAYLDDDTSAYNNSWVLAYK